MIGICVPSRGLVFAQCMQSVFDGMAKLASVGIPTKLYTSHNLPIPDAHSFIVSQALQDGCKKIIMIEEDHYVFPETFVALASSDDPILTVQYNDKNGSPHGIVHYNNQGEILWAGLGTTMIKREVFEKMGQPYFRIDHRYKVNKKHMGPMGYVVEYEEIQPRKEWDDRLLKFVEVRDPYVYGGQDVDFYTRANKLGFKAKLLAGHKSIHLDLVRLGERHINNGLHEIKNV